MYQGLVFHQVNKGEKYQYKLAYGQKTNKQKQNKTNKKQIEFKFTDL